MRIAVVGGGIAGLAAAWELRERADVLLYEPGRLGGCISTEPFDGQPVDCGPDAFITRVPDAIRLCEEAGVEDLVSPAAGRTLIWWGRKLRELPEGLVLGAPKRLGPLFRSGLLSPLGLLRAAGDLVMPATPYQNDVSVRELVSRRFGAQVADRLVDPLVGGIHAGRTADLSAEATVPQLVAATRSSRSLLLSLRSLPGGDPDTPIFAAPRAGMGRLVEKLAAGLKAAGVTIVSLAVEGLAPAGGRWRVEPAGDEVDGVVLAVPSQAAAAILGADAPGGLSRIRRASVVLVTLSFPQVDLPNGTNGILVPARSGLLTTACSFGSAKWPHWAVGGRTVLRVSTGRAGDDRGLRLDDGPLVERLSGEVQQLLGVTATPDKWRVSRWPDSFPQYEVGHRQLLEGVEAGLAARWPGVSVCGASYHGAGIPACIASGRSAAAKLADGLSEVQRRPPSTADWTG